MGFCIKAVRAATEKEKPSTTLGFVLQKFQKELYSKLSNFCKYFKLTLQVYLTVGIIFVT